MNFCKRAFNSFIGDIHPRKAFGAISLDYFPQRVDLFSGKPASQALGVNAPHAAAVRHSRSKDAKPAARNSSGNILDRKPKAQIRFIGTVLIHRLPPCHTLDRRRNIIIHNFFKDTPKQPFPDRHNIVLLNEGHLQINLRKFRLTVRAQILIAEALYNLKISVKTADIRSCLNSCGDCGSA